MLFSVDSTGLREVKNQNQMPCHIKRSAENNIVRSNAVGKGITNHSDDQQHVPLSAVGFTRINRTGDEKKVKNPLDQNITPFADRNNPLVIKYIDEDQAGGQSSYIEDGFICL